MWLAVDSGNTRLKWALMDGARIVSQGASAKDRPALPLQADLSAIWIAHVGSAQALQRIKKLVAGRRGARFLKSAAAAAGVVNRYQPPASLGVDRWLCLLAAKHAGAHQKSGAVIVSAGTAVTIDVLSAAGVFLGGVILPGLSLMPAALSRATPLPRPSAAEPSASALPVKTDDAIAAGALLAAAGAAREMRRRHAPGARLLLTGGDAEQLLPYLPRARSMPQMVFAGMAHLRALEGGDE